MFKEIVLDVGLGHALFYTPEPVWVDRVVEFALSRKALLDDFPVERARFARRSPRL